jgi:hypothetical protein
MNDIDKTHKSIGEFVIVIVLLILPYMARA